MTKSAPFFLQRNFALSLASRICWWSPSSSTFRARSSRGQSSQETRKKPDSHSHRGDIEVFEIDHAQKSRRRRLGRENPISNSFHFRHSLAFVRATTTSRPKWVGVSEHFVLGMDLPRSFVVYTEFIYRKEHAVYKCCLSTSSLSRTNSLEIRLFLSSQRWPIFPHCRNVQLSLYGTY